MRSLGRATASILCTLATLLTPLPVEAQDMGAGAGALPPNILVIVADDLGYSDLGAFGGEIATPHLDALAKQGVRLLDFHASPACSPSRASLLTGRDHHRVGMGGMPEFADELQRGQPGYEGYLLPVPTMASCLHDAGWFTAMSGKWHLGDGEDRSATARGFERSFTLTQGAANHYGLDQSDAWQGAGPGFGASYRESGHPVIYPEGAYSSDEFTRRLLAYLLGPERGHRPFFGYLALTAPHWPLQAPESDRLRYAGRYDAGPQALRAERIAKMRRLGIIGANVPAHPMIDVPDWHALPADQRVRETRLMEVYAAMVDRMDQNVGKLIAALDEAGERDRTIIIFLSDNGPDGNPAGAGRGVSPATARALGIDDSTANIGNATSFTAYGKGWAQAGSAPYSRFKGYVSEGGTRVPAFAIGPGIRGGRMTHALAHVNDIMPTVLDMAGVRDGACAAGLDGKSLRPVLSGKARSVRGQSDALFEEFLYGSSVRMGKWKALRLQPSRPPFTMGSMDARWQLYDMERDPGETRDLARRRPRLLNRLIGKWTDYARKAKVVLAHRPSRLNAARHARFGLP